MKQPPLYLVLLGSLESLDPSVWYFCLHQNYTQQTWGTIKACRDKNFEIKEDMIMIANEITFHKKLNNADVGKYKSMVFNNKQIPYRKVSYTKHSEEKKQQNNSLIYKQNIKLK